MIEEETIPRALIDPEDFRGTTVAVEQEVRPYVSLTAKLIEPLTYVGKRRKASIIRIVGTGDGYVVNWDVVLKGGVDKGLRFRGMLEEISLRYHTVRGLPKSPMSPNAWMFP